MLDSMHESQSIKNDWLYFNLIILIVKDHQRCQMKCEIQILDVVAVQCKILFATGTVMSP